MELRILKCLLVALLGIQAYFALTPALAQSTSSAQTNRSNQISGDQSVDPQISLLDLGETESRIMRAADELRTEFNRKVYNSVDEYLMNPEGYPNMYVQPDRSDFKALPPRKKWVDYAIAQLHHLVNIQDSEVAEASSLAGQSTATKVQFEILSDNCKQVDTQVQALATLSQSAGSAQNSSPGYDRTKMLETIQALKDEASGLESIRKRLLRITKDKSS